MERAGAEEEATFRDGVLQTIQAVEERREGDEDPLGPDSWPHGPFLTSAALVAAAEAEGTQEIEVVELGEDPEDKPRQSRRARGANPNPPSNPKLTAEDAVAQTLTSLGRPAAIEVTYKEDASGRKTIEWTDALTDVLRKALEEYPGAA